MFRTVAFSGSDLNPIESGFSSKWVTPVVAFIHGSRDAVEVARTAILEVSEAVNLPVELTDDPAGANFVMCVGLDGNDYRTVVDVWSENLDIDQDLDSGLFFAQLSEEWTIAKVWIVTAESPESGEPFDDTFVQSAIWEETVQSFGLFNDFRWVEFRDVAGAATSLFRDDVSVTTDLSPLDRKLLEALYALVPSGSTWADAVDRLVISDRTR